MGVKIGAAALLLMLAVSLRATEPRVLRPGDSQKTTRDKLYSKEQAARGEAIYVKHCERCHTPDKVPAGKKPGAAIFGDKFFENWADKTLGEMFDTILNTMPSDGTAVLTVDQALDVTAHLLKANGFPDGPAPLKNDETMKTAVIVKPGSAFSVPGPRF
jgi:mono/diheme cytochrome c family protein